MRGREDTLIMAMFETHGHVQGNMAMCRQHGHVLWVMYMATWPCPLNMAMCEFPWSYLKLFLVLDVLCTTWQNQTIR